MKLLIIGSKGFIGSHCVDFFKNRHEVWECDVVSDYVTPRYHLIDATNSDYEEVFSSTTFDVCINCSGAASVSDSISNPQRDFFLNVVNVFKQLDAIRKHQPSCKYINLSSAAVYGNPVTLPIDESHPLKPISPYGCHKRMAEDLCQEFSEKFNLQTASLRIFSAYGPGLKKQLFWDLYRKYKWDDAIILYGTGRESRDFIYINDVVQAIDCVIQNSSFNNDIVNVACGEELTIQNVTGIFYNIIDAGVTFSFGGEARKGDPNNWIADISKLKKMGFTQQVDLNTGLKNYHQWLNESG